MTTDPDRLITVDEAADLFGLPHETLRESIAAGELAVVPARGRTPHRMRVEDVRVFARGYFAVHAILMKPKEQP